ncbi:MAG: aminopeptidase P family protein [Candidatus Kapabacteria bacterium]|nr:aminopeptidase P family protein [Candidatus Kapabacteria bacterium]
MRISLILLWACLSQLTLMAQTLRYEVHDNDLVHPRMYKERRERVLASMSPQSIAIVFSADVRNRQNDVDYEYRQSSDMLYLAGVPSPGATLLLVPRGVKIGQKIFRTVLFIKDRNPKQEVWQGVTMGPAEVIEHLEIDTAISTQYISDVLDSLLPSTDTVHLSNMPTRALSVPLTSKNIYADVDLKKWLKARQPNLIVKSPMAVLARLREVKDSAELRLMQKAIDISMEGHRLTMQGARPGMHEYELEALMEYAFKRQGAEDVGYPSIVGSSYNACILHYISNRRTTQRNDLVLADCGAEYHGYTADITRTFPMNGTFTREQRLIYNVVLEAQDSGIAASKAGDPFRAPHKAAKDVISKRLMELGIIDSADHVGRYFMHGTSHYLGLDVHDPGTSGPLQVNSVITVEPGVYIPEGSPCDKKWWNIGVRIEDDILITADGPVNMSGSLARTVEEIEAMVGKAP